MKKWQKFGQPKQWLSTHASSHVTTVTLGRGWKLRFWHFKDRVEFRGPCLRVQPTSVSVFKIMFNVCLVWNESSWYTTIFVCYIIQCGIFHWTVEREQLITEYLGSESTVSGTRKVTRWKPDWNKDGSCGWGCVSRTLPAGLVARWELPERLL